jgi:hypothetical protein
MSGPEPIDVGGENEVDDRFWNLVIPGIVLAGMILVPAVSAEQDLSWWENLMSNSNDVPPPTLDNQATRGSDTPLSTEVDLSSPLAATDPTPYVSLPSPPAIGSVSAWAKQGSSSGSADGATTLIEFKQTVTASGKIQKLMFSASVVL